MNNINQVLSQLSTEQREKLLQNALKQAGKNLDKIGVNSRAGVGVPLSLTQQRLWFLEQLDGQSALYNMPCVLKLSGSLNQQALEDALNFVVDRHSILRTCFTEVTGVAQQIIQDTLVLSIPTLTLSSEQDVQAAILKEAALPFDLTKAPLVRAQLLKINETCHILLFTMHHIISDS